MAYEKLSLTRDQFAAFLQDFEQIKQFEKLFANTNANVILIDDINLSAGNAGESANDALAQIIELSDTLNKEPIPANVSQLAVVQADIQALALSPALRNGVAPPNEGGTGTSTQFTEGSIVFAGASGVYTQDNANLFWNNTTNDLGIGTIPSGAKLDVAGLIRSRTGAATLDVNHDGIAGSVQSSNNLLLYANGANSLISHTNNIERMRITSIGDVGIGNTPSGAKLDVTGLIRSRTGAATLDVNHDGVKGSIQSSNELLLYANGANSLISHTNNIERMRISSIGDVGIGNTPSGAKLDVSGLIRSRTGAATLDVNHDGINGSVQSSNDLLLYANGANSIRLHTNSVEQFRIGSAGQVGISGANYGSSGQVLTSSGASAAPTWTTVSSGSGVASFSAGTTGFTPSTATTGAVTLAGTLNVANGGTGVTTSTGTVSVVLSNSPTLVTPILGAASATSIANGLGLVATPSYTFTGDLNSGMWSPASDTVAFSTNGAERIRIASNGDVGINNTPSGAKLDVSGLIRSRTSAATIDVNHDGVNGSVQSSNDLLLYANGASSLKLHTNSLERMRITSIGDVGIGNTPAGAKLDVTGLIRSRTGSATVDVNHDGIAGSVQSSNDLLLFANGASSVVSHTNNIERMRVDSSGNVGIGTTSPNASAILDVQSTTKGFRLPNMTTTQKNAISSPAAGLMVFDTTLAKACIYSGAAWETITSV